MTAPTDTRGPEATADAGDQTPGGLSADDLRAPITLPDVGSGRRTGRRRGDRRRTVEPEPGDRDVPGAERLEPEPVAAEAGDREPPGAERLEPEPVAAGRIGTLPPVEIDRPGGVARATPEPDTSGPSALRAPTVDQPPVPTAPDDLATGARPGSAPWSLLLVVAAVGILVVALVAMAWAILDRLSDTVGGSDAGSGAEPAAPAVVARSRAVAIVRVDGEMVGVTVVALGRGDAGGTAVFLPPGTVLDHPDGEPRRLDTVDDEGTIERAVEDLVGAPVGLTVTLDEDAWVEQLPDHFVFENPAPIERVLTDGSSELLYPAGPVDVTSADIPALLAGRSGDETDVDRLVRQQRLWEAWVDVVAAEDGPVAGEPTSDLDTFMAALARGPVDYRLLPVEVLDADDRSYVTDGTEAPLILAALAPERLAEGDGDRVQLLNGVGIPGLATDVAAMLVPEGLAVPLTDNADEFGYSRTQIVYYRPESEATASSVRALLGVGDVVASRTVLDAVDVTVLIGEDLASRIGVLDVTAVASGDATEQASQEN